MKTTPTTRLPYWRTAALIAGLIAGSFTLTGCGTDSRLAAVEAALAVYAESNPDYSGLTVPYLNEKLQEISSDEEAFSLSAAIIDMESLSATDLVPSGELTDIRAEITSEGLTSFSSSLEDTSSKLVAALEDPPIRDAEVKISITSNGEDISAEVTGASGGKLGSSRELAGKLLPLTPQWRQFVVRATAAKWLGEVFADSESFLDSVTVGDVTLAADSATAQISYPNVQAVYPAASQAVFDEYVADKPIFGEVTLADFTDKVESKVSAQNASPASGTVTVKTSTSTEAMLAEEDLLAEAVDNLSGYEPLVDFVRLNWDAQVLSSDIVGDSPATVRAATVKDHLDKLNSKHVVKEKKVPGTKRLSGSTSGVQLTIKLSKTRANTHVVFYKKDPKKGTLSVFAHSGKSLTVRIPAGKYWIMNITGSSWYGDKYSFGPTGNYNKSYQAYTFQRNYTYTYNMGTESTGGDSVPTQSTSFPFK